MNTRPANRHRVGYDRARGYRPRVSKIEPQELVSEGRKRVPVGHGKGAQVIRGVRVA